MNKESDSKSSLRSAVKVLHLLLGTYFWSQNMHLIDAYVSTFKPQMASRSSDFAVSATVVCRFSAMPDL